MFHRGVTGNSSIASLPQKIAEFRQRRHFAACAFLSGRTESQTSQTSQTRWFSFPTTYLCAFAT
jgi:hypothetical protein